MPELPEVENVRRSLEVKVTGQGITGVDILDSRPIKYNEIEDFKNRIIGKSITKVDRRGKFLLLTLEGASGKEILIVHLAMTGALLYRGSELDVFHPNVENHILISFNLANGKHLIFSDYRRFGSVRVVTEYDLHFSGESHLKTLQEMGPEPFESDAEEQFLERIGKKRYQSKFIKDVLLDQRVVAGVGNIYANEALFPLGINPYTFVEELDETQLREIFRNARDLMKLSIEMGGTSIRDYVDGEGKSGSFQDVLKVYNQILCKECKTPIIKSQMNNRATYYCPTCQPEFWETGETS